MKVIRTEIPEVLLLEPRVFEDARGVAFESYNRRTFREDTGLDPDFVEALAFAWLARQCIHNQPGNLPHVTGAAGPRILGAVYPC